MRDLNEALRLHQQGELTAAAALYEGVIERTPHQPDALRLLGLLRRDQGDVAGALSLLRRAYDAAPSDAQARANLVATLTLPAASASPLGPGWDDTLLALLVDPGVDPRRIRHPAAAAVRRLGIDSPLGRALLASTPVADEAIEAELVAVRRRMALGPPTAPSVSLELAAAVALQAIHCDYAQWAGVDELAAIDAITQDPTAKSLADLTLMAAYRRLADLSGAEELAHRHARSGDTDDPRLDVLRASLHEPLLERALAEKLTRLSPVQGAVSVSVRAQYEEHPYPRWSRLGAMRRSPLAAALQATVPRWRPPEHWPEQPNVLVAGCGTGAQPLQLAVPHAEARILGVDLSLASLGHAARKTRELGVTNLELMHGDLLEIRRLGRQFDYIESIGVLHHMADPTKGWRALTDVLAPGGLMKIGLYSERARTLVVQARRILEEQRYPASANGVRRFRQDLLTGANPALAPLRALRNWTEFHTLGECRDLLFHVQEHRFTPTTIAAALHSLGLQFLGLPPPRTAINSLPELDATEQAERPGAQPGMYVLYCAPSGYGAGRR